jgi:cell division septal protein FtsQ
VYKYNPRKRRRALKGYVLPDEKTERIRRRLRWRRLLVVLALLAAIAGTVALYRSPLLRVDDVEVIGTTNVAPERVVTMPLVKAVQARLRWPDKVEIEVIERTPWGYWNLAGTSYVVDGEGVILPDVKPPKGAPVIHDTGSPTTLSPGDRVDADAVRLAQALLESVPEQLSLTIAQLEYKPENGLSLVTDAEYRVVMGDSQNADYKLAVWKTVEEDIGRDVMAGHVLDLRFRDRPSFQ